MERCDRIRPVNQDLDIIVKHYGKKFGVMFPRIAQQQFIDWINEDTYGGWEETNHGHAAGRRELKVLYAVIRATKPKNILEIGTYNGDSLNHILLACEKNKEEGLEAKVTTIDISEYLNGRKLHDYPYERVLESSLSYLEKYNDFDFIVQDGNHKYPSVIRELKLFKENKSLRYVWAHDYYLPGRGVKKAYHEKAHDVFSYFLKFKEPLYKAGFVIGEK